MFHPNFRRKQAVEAAKHPTLSLSPSPLFSSLPLPEETDSHHPPQQQ
jgi:hypothetical protein